jgi:trimeric autotransporter adhesin
LTITQIPVLSTAAVAALTTAQINVLTVAEVMALTTAQIAALNCIEQRAMTQAQVNALSIPQLNALKLGTPLVLDLSGNGIHTTNIAAGATFDLNATGQKLGVGWLSPENGFLVLDLNNDGAVNDGSELFGGGTRLPTGERAVNGFAALQALDNNHDDVIDAKDIKFHDLKVWVDANQDGRSQSSEMHSLIDLGIVELDLNASNVSIDNNGNVIGMLSSYVTLDGKSHALADVWLQISSNAQNRVIDLSVLNAASITPGSLGQINLSGNGGQGDLLMLNADAILKFGMASGMPDAISDIRQILVTGDANDMVELMDSLAQWHDAGTTTVNGAEYHVYSHESVQLLIGVDMRIEWAFA